MDKLRFTKAERIRWDARMCELRARAKGRHRAMFDSLTIFSGNRVCRDGFYRRIAMVADIARSWGIAWNQP